MCRPNEKVNVKIGDRLFSIDKCISDLVEWLNKDVVITNACCCGHGKAPGVIVMADGSAIVIYKDTDVMSPEAYNQYQRVKLPGVTEEGNDG